MQNLTKFKLPIILALILLVPILFGKFVPENTKVFLYAMSLSMKSILLFVLPFIIFSFIFSSLIRLQSSVIKFVLLLISMVFISNFIAICAGFGISHLLLPYFSVAANINFGFENALQANWHLSLPKLISNEIALISGFAFGIFFSFFPNQKANKIALCLNHIAHTFLSKVFVPLLPMFILGFVFKLEHDQMLAKALKFYGPVFFIVVGTQVLYMILLYMIAANFSLNRFTVYIKNVLPAMLTGFSTISSAATMPILIMSTEKNIGDANMAKTIVPATINIHTLGSALGLTILLSATMMTFNKGIPDFNNFIVFAFFYTIAKFAVVAVPGGVMLVVSPLLEVYLGFSSEMIGLLTAIYMMFDPFGTAINVTGNGASAILFSKLYARISK